MKDKKNIDQVFRPLEDYSPELGPEQLDDFCVRLDKMRYYRFGWRYFNIYYTGIILAGVVSIVVLWSRQSNEENKSQIKNQSVIIYSEEKEQQKSEVVEETDSLKVLPKVNSLVKETNSVIVPEPNNIDSIVASIEQNSVIEQKDTSVNTLSPPKVIIVKKRDTIFTFDTTRVKRRKK